MLFTGDIFFLILDSLIHITSNSMFVLSVRYSSFSTFLEREHTLIWKQLEVFLWFSNLFPFATMNDYKLHQTLSQSNNHNSDSSDSYSTMTCSTLKATKNLSKLFNEFNIFFSAK